MLPIVKRRTLHVPHRLAVAAAVVGLALSFAIDRSTVEERLQAEQGGTPAVEQTTGSAGENGAAQDGDSAAKRRHRERDLSLLPWFSGLRNQ